MATILLGTVALEPNRWGTVDDRWNATIEVGAWLDAISEAGFDGVELWEKHLTTASQAEVDRIISHDLPVPVFNSYVSLDDADPAGRTAVAKWAERAGSTGIKYNTGNEEGDEERYSERIAAWLDELPADTALLCECHAGISIAEIPEVAVRIFEAAGPADRVQAIVHLNEEPDHIRARFDAYGDRITHIHVNFLDVGPPPLDGIRDRVQQQVTLLTDLGFNGSWTVEFVAGLLTDDDNPEHLMPQAVADLAVLRELLP